MAVSIRNTTSATDAPTAPTHEDGTPYTFEMIYAGGARRGYADSHTELVGLMIDGYPASDSPKELMKARIRLAMDWQVRLQALINTEMQEQLADCDEQQLAILLGSRDVPPTPVQWDCPIPLVLVDTFYKPIGTVPRPNASDDEALIWLDPNSDRSLLLTGHSAGAISLFSAGPADPQER